MTQRDLQNRSSLSNKDVELISCVSLYEMMRKGLSRVAECGGLSTIYRILFCVGHQHPNLWNPLPKKFSDVHYSAVLLSSKNVSIFYVLEQNTDFWKVFVRKPKHSNDFLLSDVSNQKGSQIEWVLRDWRWLKYRNEVDVWIGFEISKNLWALLLHVVKNSRYFLLHQARGRLKVLSDSCKTNWARLIAWFCIWNRNMKDCTVHSKFMPG